MNFEIFYNLENYLFKVVNELFHQRGYLTTEEFYCIIIWKSNRSKTKTIKRLGGKNSFKKTVRKISTLLYQSDSDKEKMKILIMQFGFRLPIASAILSVLYPKSFSVYDYRVCEILQHELGNLNYINIQNWKFERLWSGYEVYLRDVRQCSGNLEYREADKYLWGKSFYIQNCKPWLKN